MPEEIVPEGEPQVFFNKVLTMALIVEFIMNVPLHSKLYYMITIFSVGDYYVSRFNMQLIKKETNEVTDITEMSQEWFDSLSADEKSTLQILSNISGLNEEGKTFLKRAIGIKEEVVAI